MTVRYFFHTPDGAHHWDTQGVELVDDQDAGIKAVVLMGEILRDEPSLLSADHPFRIVVRDKAGQLKYCVLATITD